VVGNIKQDSSSATHPFSRSRHTFSLGLDVMTFLPAQVQADTIGMFGCACEAISGGQLL
jgi:hypothetical protein